MKSYSEKTDSEHLRSLLTSMTEELSLNFLERRGKNKSHKGSLLEELQDVIGELTHRERDLQAAAGIALMMLERNNKLQEKRNKIKAKLLNALEKAHHQTIDIHNLREALVASETKNEQISKTLKETEEIMLTNSAELSRMLKERFTESYSSVSEEDVEHIKSDFKSQLESIQKKRYDLEKENKKIVELNKVNDSKYNDLKSKYDKLESKYYKIVDSLKSMENDKLMQAEELESIDAQLKVMTTNYQRMKVHAERLEEEMALLEGKGQHCLKVDENHATSLHSELENMDDSYESIPAFLTQEDQSVEEIVYMKPTHHHSVTPQTRTSSLMSYFRMFSTCNDVNIHISPIRAQRKQPPEEYFLLTAQAVKMNSPHMDSICMISTHDLYQKALKEGIPFHKWHLWIESQLNSAYVQQLYKSTRRTIWKKYGQKICL